MALIARKAVKALIQISVLNNRNRPGNTAPANDYDAV
jgi:hypothetical protein